MYCKNCTQLYTLDLRLDHSVYFKCDNCNYQEDIPYYIYVSFETIYILQNNIKTIINF